CGGAEEPERRRQTTHDDPTVTKPLERNAGGQDERLRRFIFVGQHVEDRADVVAADPGVGQVAEEMRRALVVPHDFGPLPPSLWALVREEELQELVGAVAPAEAHEGADVADLVRRERVPSGTTAPRHEEVPVLLERAFYGSTWQRVARLHGRECDRRRRGVEVSEIGAAGDEIDLVLVLCELDGTAQIA